MLSQNEYKKLYTDYQAIFVPVFLIIIILKKEKYWLLFCKIYRTLIPFYILFMLYLMFFGFGRSSYDFNIVRLVPVVSTAGFIRETIQWKTIVINVFGNIIMFIPFGFLGIVFKKLNSFKRLIINFLSVIIIIESFQYFTRLGVFDIDDIILNTIGVAIGFGIYKWLTKTIIDRDF